MVQLNSCGSRATRAYNLEETLCESMEINAFWIRVDLWVVVDQVLSHQRRFPKHCFGIQKATPRVNQSPPRIEERGRIRDRREMCKKWRSENLKERSHLYGLRAGERGKTEVYLEETGGGNVDWIHLAIRRAGVNTAQNRGEKNCCRQVTVATKFYKVSLNV